MPFFSKVFRREPGASKAKKNTQQSNGGAIAPPKPRWEDAWSRKEVAPEEIHELIRGCTHEMKSRVLDMPFLLLPFRPGSDAGSSRIFITKFFRAQYEGSQQFSGYALQQELRLTEPMVLCSIMKWCWSRLPGGVVTWDVYEMFKMGEQDAHMARHSFDTFVPLAVETPARRQIIFDFFDLLAAIAARGKTNGLGGRKLSRMAGWWAFELSDQGNGFDGGYRSWQNAADAASHMFFAYLRSLSPDPVAGAQGISQLPRSLQSLLSQTEYPPQPPALMFTTTPKVVMIVDAVSPTPFALLRRARNFEYRDDDVVLQQFSSFEDPVRALTDECRRVLNEISSTNASAVLSSGPAKKAQDPTWSRFEDIGFSGINDNGTQDAYSGGRVDSPSPTFGDMRANPRSRTTNLGRPTTPSWADFLSSGFVDERGNTSASTPMLLPPDKQLPPIGENRGHSSQSHVRNGHADGNLEPGELASITKFDLDDTFWWVWMTSLAGEEPASRKAVFGRCALIETSIHGGRWLVMEEQVKGASPGPEEGAYIAEKKGIFSFTKRSRMNRRKSTGKKNQPPAKEQYSRSAASTPYSRITIGADQQAKIQAAAQALVDQQRPKEDPRAPNRALSDTHSKTNSMMTLESRFMSEAAPAMKWAREFDRGAIRARYLGDNNMGTGRSVEALSPIQSTSNFSIGNGSITPKLQHDKSNRELPALPQDNSGLETPRGPSKTAAPPPLPPATPTGHGQADLPLPIGDEKPAPSDHPALRNGSSSQSTERPPKQSTSSPESAKAGKTSPTKLKKGGKPQKQSGGGGLKKLFGGKKKENRASRAITPQPPKEEFRADTPEQFEPEPEPEPAPAQAPAAPPKAEPTFSPQDVDDHMDTDLSRVHTNDEREAEHEFNRFDQGPLEDVPAFVPHDRDDTPEPPDAAAAPPDFGPRSPATRKPVGANAPPPGPPPAESPLVPPTDSDASTPAEENLSSTSQAAPADRWAQIRKNAAERAQRYTAEETGGPSGGPSARSHSQSASRATDDGDTSGEETIESRVARIKARVAELTGNMEQGGGRR